MKKKFTLAITGLMAAALTASAFGQGRSRSCNSGNSVYSSQRSSRVNYDNSQSYDNSRAYYDYGTQYRGQGVWDRHRDKLTVGAGTLGGAIVGGLIGGRKGAVIGALAGGGGSALYTYKLRDRRYRN